MRKLRQRIKAKRMIYLIFTFQLIILNAVAQILLALLMYTAVSYCTLLKKNLSECTLLKMLCTQSTAEVNVDAISQHAMSALKKIVTSHFYFHTCREISLEFCDLKGKGVQLL